MEAGNVNIVILAAGRGSRLGRPTPKALTTLADGRTILGRQLGLLAEAFGSRSTTCVVVGFKAALLLEAAASAAVFVYNDSFDRTNTARSLLRALRLIGSGGVMWLNGDVVFIPELTTVLASSVAQDESFVAVSRRPVEEEEVKYLTDTQGYIRQISKEVVYGSGEAVGINYVSGADRSSFVRNLESCSDDDYYERAIERSIHSGLRFRAIDVSDYDCVEVDFESDVEEANRLVERTVRLGDLRMDRGVVQPSAPPLEHRRRQSD